MVGHFHLDELMAGALEEASRARDAGEVPIGAAARAVGNYRLTGATLCVTIEPCLMCVGALVHARIGTLVYGAAETRTGAIVSTVHALDLPGHNHRLEVVSGVCEDECRALMQAF